MPDHDKTASQLILLEEYLLDTYRNDPTAYCPPWVHGINHSEKCKHWASIHTIHKRHLTELNKIPEHIAKIIKDLQYL